jgi:hypothetical protein
MLGDLLDVSHPAAAKWLATPPARGPKPRRTTPAAPSGSTVPTREDLLRVKFAKQTAEVRRIEIQNQVTLGELIPREPVRVHVFGTIDAAFERLVRDVPRSSAARAMAATRANAPAEEIEQKIRDAITSVLKPLKQKIVRALRHQSDPEEVPADA